MHSSRLGLSLSTATHVGEDLRVDPVVDRLHRSAAHDHVQTGRMSRSEAFDVVDTAVMERWMLGPTTNVRVVTDEHGLIVTERFTSRIVMNGQRLFPDRHR